MQPKLHKFTVNLAKIFVTWKLLNSVRIGQFGCFVYYKKAIYFRFNMYTFANFIQYLHV